MDKSTAPRIEEHRFADDGTVPNSQLPLIVYRAVLDTGPDAAAVCERRFAANGWSGGWRGGIYPYHHYHSTAHEALGVVRGSARVRLGGYAGGRGPDLRVPGRGDRERVLDNIKRVARPTVDPVCGRGGPLCASWARTA